MIANAGRSLIILLAVTLSLVTVAGAQPQRFFGGIGDVDALTFTDDQKLLLATGYLVVEYDLETHAIAKIHHPWQSRPELSLLSVPGNSTVLGLSNDLHLRLWDRLDGAVVESDQLVPGYDPASSAIQLPWVPLLSASPDGDLLAVLVRTTGAVSTSELRIYDAATLTLLDVRTEAGGFLEVTPLFSEDGKTVYTSFSPIEGTGNEYNPPIMEWHIPSDVDTVHEGMFTSRFLIGMAVGADGFKYALGSQSYGCTLYACGIHEISWMQEISCESHVLTANDLWGPFPAGSRGGAACWSGACSIRLNRFVGDRPIFSARGSYLVQSGSLIHADSGAVIRSGLPLQCVFGADERMLGTIEYGYSSTAKVLRTEDGTIVDLIPGISLYGLKHLAQLHGEGRLLALGNAHVSAFNMESGQLVQSDYFETMDPGKVIASPNESSLAYRNGWNVEIGSADDLTTRGLLLNDTANVGAAFNPANDRLLVVAGGLQEYEINPDDYAASLLVRTYDPQTTATVVYTCAAYSLDGSVLLAARGNGVPQLHRYDAVSGSLLSTTPLVNQWDDVEFDPTGAVLLVKENGTRSIYDAQTLEKRYTLTGPIRAAAFALDGGLLITAGDDAIKLWRTASGDFLGSTPVISELWVNSIVPSPLEDIVYIADGERILEWRLPLRAALEHPEDLQLDPILKRDHTITPVDRNGDGIYDAADVLLEAREVGAAR
jgi:WD40 repeat protein